MIETLLDSKTNKYKLFYNGEEIISKTKEEYKEKISEIETKEDFEFTNMYKFMLLEKLINN